MCHLRGDKKGKYSILWNVYIHINKVTDNTGDTWFKILLFRSNDHLFKPSIFVEPSGATFISAFNLKNQSILVCQIAGSPSAISLRANHIIFLSFLFS